MSKDEIQIAREMWLFVHDIARDKSGETFNVQEVIDMASEAYLLCTGQKSEDWLAE